MKKGFWIVVALLIASVAMNVWFWQTVPEPSIVIERDTVWKDSIRVRNGCWRMPNCGSITPVRLQFVAKIFPKKSW